MLFVEYASQYTCCTAATSCALHDVLLTQGMPSHFAQFSLLCSNCRAARVQLAVALSLRRMEHDHCSSLHTTARTQNKKVQADILN
jgi:hypothetical protein